MKKISIFLYLLLFSSVCFAEEFKYNPFLNGLDITNNKATEISVENADDYFGSIASPPTVESALKELAASREIVNTFTKCQNIEDLLSSDDNISFGIFDDDTTIIGISCQYKGSGTIPANISLQDGAGNTMTITNTTPSCSNKTGIATFEIVTTGNILLSGETVEISVTNTPSPTTDDYVICLKCQQ